MRMIPANHLLAGGIISSIIAFLGTLLNTLALIVLCGDRKLRKNSTTVLIIFLSISNLISSAVVLPLETLSLLYTSFFKGNSGFCEFHAFLYFLNYNVLICLEAALALNRWAAVCTKSCR